MADFTWSFSSIKEYINCPKKYQEVRILKNYTFTDTQSTIYGKEVHTALEEYVRDGKPLAKNYQRFQKMVDTLIAIPGEKYPELKMALTKQMKAMSIGGIGTRLLLSRLLYIKYLMILESIALSMRRV